MKAMMSLLRYLTLSVLAAGLLLPAGAQAQYYGAPPRQPPPLYPYAVQDDRGHAVDVARPARSYPYVGRNAAPAFDRRHKRADRTLTEELRRRAPVKRTVINTKRIVHDAPVVVETERVVDDPPRVIERRHVVEDADRNSTNSISKKRAGRDDTKKRVIAADAEITIIGPDRMSIRLFRKGQGSKANARVE